MHKHNSYYRYYECYGRTLRSKRDVHAPVRETEDISDLGRAATARSTITTTSTTHAAATIATTGTAHVMPDTLLGRRGRIDCLG
mmetsp:Transcript_19662/g.42868  ORF Transcript_19662/g.42868 Transcript_19662/m.42868 type:complete len:84 (-) Transcript_19662:1000-1251(-)